MLPGDSKQLARSALIQVEGVAKSYTKGSITTEVLKEITLRVDPGEFVSIMGSSGTGKSTLMNILGALDKPSSGRYLLDGVDVAALDDDALSRLRNRRIGFVFQQFHLLDRATVLRNVMLPLAYDDTERDDPEARALQVISAVELGDRTYYLPSELSGGEQQRVAIARALVNDPAILLADEPTGNLDRRSGLGILAIFQRLNRDGGTIVMITHDQEVAEHAQRVLSLRDGRIVEDRAVSKPRDAEAALRALSADTLATGEAVTQVPA